MLTDEQIEFNKNKFINLLKRITRQDSLIEELINKLEHSDFFTAPASTQYHSAFKGGLCQHSLNVYEELVNLINMKYPTLVQLNEETQEEEVITNNPYSEETLIIVALLHDFSKMNFYEISTRNVKDESGNWTQVPYIKVKDAKDKFIYSHHGANSEYMVGRFIPLTLEESVAIIHHMGWSDEHSDAKTISEVYNRFPLALYLHIADCLATFTRERI